MSYPEGSPGPSLKRDQALSLAATIVPMVVLGYDHPRKVAACWQHIARHPTQQDQLWSFGHCLAQRTKGQDWSACLQKQPWVQGPASAPGGSPPAAPRLPCPAPPTGEDAVRMVVSVANVGEALYSFFLSTAGHSGMGRPMPADLRDALGLALRNATLILDNDPPRRGSLPRHRFPGLALSGGAANGAFTAGYMHALLALREAALEGADVAPGLRRHIDLAHRFGSASGTSVGALINLYVDLYFSHVPGDAVALKQLQPRLRACLKVGQAGGPDALPASRAIQRCALEKLRTDFIQDEWRLLCVEDGYITDLMDDKRSVLRFDPLRDNYLRPFMKDFGQLIVDNDFIRVAMVVDLRQNVVMGLDERVCRMPALGSDDAGRSRCVINGILASISNPALAAPIPVVHSGLRGAGGESGVWLDGGLRSGTPAARAITLTSRKLLAVNTHRAEGIPKGAWSNAFGILMGAVDNMVLQNRQWEMAQAQLWRTDQLRKQEVVNKALGRALTGHLTAVPPLQLSGDLLPVFVPDKIEPRELFADGYTFDPFVMKGLFLHGQKTFLRSHQQIYRWLGWNKMLEVEQSSAAFRARLAQLRQAVDLELKTSYDNLDVARWRPVHISQRRKLLQENLKKCP